MTEYIVDTATVGRRKIIERPRLTRLLDESPARIKMLVAPAGYGKTTLARQWLEQRGHRSAWSRIPPAGTDIAVVAAALARGAALVVDSADSRLRDRLAVTQAPETDARSLAEILVSDVHEWPRDAWLVIDDLHHVDNGTGASDFVASLVHESTINVLVCTRHRPEWASARDILYGDILEIGRSTLAMTREEASEVLGEATSSAPGLVELAEGWPAVVGLAALAAAPLDTSGERLALPETLHDFLADELYRSLPQRLRHGLCKLALAGIRSRSIAADLLSDEGGEAALDAAVRGGWLSIDPHGSLELHPLMEAFLRSKIESRAISLEAADVEPLASFLIEHESWDEAFALIEYCDEPRLLQSLIGAALDPLLSAGRLSTLRKWVAYAERANLGSPEVALVSAELAFREGRFAEAEALGRNAARAFGASSRLKGRAFIAAGRAAHAANREELAFEYYRRARDAVGSESDKRLAILGELSAAIDLELPEAEQLLEDARPDESDVDALVLHACRSLSFHQRFGVPLPLDEPRRIAQLLPLARDPFTRCSFRNAFGYTLAGAGERDEMNSLVEAQLADAESYRLDFVVPYVWLQQAVLAALTNNLAVAAAHADKMERSGRAAGDGMLIANAVAVRARCAIARGEYGDAIALTLRSVGAVTKAMAAELVATRAVALACQGDVRRALETAAFAESQSRCTEVQVCVAATRAIEGIRRGDAMSDYAASALRVAIDAHCLECFAAAYRGFPQLSAMLLGDSTTREAMLRVLVTACDSHLQQLIDLDAGAGSGSWMSLSPREQEVLLFVSHGRSNRDIGRALFISEATVKVHVRHIFEKLGVKSRTEAALRIPQYARTAEARNPQDEATN